MAVEERAQRMVVWRPGPAPSDVLALSASYRDDGCGQAQQQQQAASPVVAPSELPPISWRSFLLTQAAGVYGTMFRRAVPREADAARELRQRQKHAWWRRALGVAGSPETWSSKRVGDGEAVIDGAWSAAASMGVVKHDFVLVKPLKLGGSGGGGGGGGGAPVAVKA